MVRNLVCMCCIAGRTLTRRRAGVRLVACVVVVDRIDEAVQHRLQASDTARLQIRCANLVLLNKVLAHICACDC